MNYTIEVIPDEPIIVFTTLKQYSFAVDDPVADGEIQAILNNSSRPLFLVIDATQLSVGLDDIVEIANKDGRGEQSLYHHPNIKEILFISHNDMVRLAVKGLTTVTFGSLHARAFKRLNEALAYIHSQTAT